MNNVILVDYINVKTLPELVIDYLKKCNIKSSLNSIRNIYSLILREISFEVEESYLNRLQKYLSSHEQSTINLLEDINDNIYDSQLLDAIRKINSEIAKADISIFYEEIFKLVHYIHFDDNDYDELKTTYNKENYDQLLFLLFKHAFKFYKTNTPKILAERLFEDAKCQRNTLLRYNLLKVAADLGHSLAAYEYATHCISFDEKLYYLIKSKDINPSIWQLGWILERNQISDSQYNQIVSELEDIIQFSKNNGARNIKVYNNTRNINNKHLVSAYHIYYYLAKSRNFSKGYNSIGKLLINNIIVYTDNSDYINLGIEYLKLSASLGNVHAMQNLALYYRKQNIDINIVKELLYMGADNEELICCTELADILMKEGKNNEAIKYLKHAANNDNTKAQHQLGKYYENKFDYDNAKYWFKESIKNGNTKTVIDLALLYFQEHIDENNPLLLTNAITLLKNNLDNFDEESKITANKLLSEWTKE